MALLPQPSLSSPRLRIGFLSKVAGPKSLNLFTQSKPAKSYRGCKASWQEVCPIFGFSFLLSQDFSALLTNLCVFFFNLFGWYCVKLAGVLVFSAIPFTAVKAIANSPLGELLQRRLEENKKAAIDNSSKFKALAQKARKDR